MFTEHNTSKERADQYYNNCLTLPSGDIFKLFILNYNCYYRVYNSELGEYSYFFIRLNLEII